MGGSQKSSLQIPSAFHKLDDATHNEDVNYDNKRMRAAAVAHMPQRRRIATLRRNAAVAARSDVNERMTNESASGMISLALDMLASGKKILLRRCLQSVTNILHRTMI